MENRINIVDINGKVIDKVEVSSSILVDTLHNQSMFDVVIAENAAMRQGTHSTLTKAEVSGGGRKPYKQKHTGRARQGSIRNPHYRHGGVAFGPKPNRNYMMKVNRKVHTLAFKSAFSLHMQNNSITCISDELNVANPSTKVLVNFFKSLKLDGNKILFVTLEKNDNLRKSVANIAKVNYRVWNCVSPRDLLNYKYLIVQPNVIKKWVEVY